MKIHELIQGSQEWLDYRKKHRNASDAAAMLGISPYKTRSQLLHEVWTGLQQDFTEYQQTKIIDPGHAFEESARSIAESVMGEQLFPVVGSQDGSNLSASFDGLTFTEGMHFEHKRLSAVLRECMPDHGENENVALPRYHYVQVQQQFMCAEKSEACLFMASEWTADDELIDERHCWVYPDADEQAIIEAGWRQFDVELAAYTPPKAEPATLVGVTMESLPALRVLAHGEVTDTNVEDWAKVARAVLSSINRTLNTDQDFADAAEAIKWCGKQESALDAAKEHVLSQTESIDKVLKVMAAIKEETRQIRLEQEKLVDRRKTERKSELVSETVAAWHSFSRETNAGLSPYTLPQIAMDFAGVIKGKRNFTSMQDALSTELARVKIEATNAAQAIGRNARLIAEHKAHAFLFNDAASLVHKDAEAVAVIVRGRIDAHEAEQKRKAEEAAEAAREKIRAEERAKAEAEAAAKAKAERDAQEARDREAKAEEERQAAERRRQDEEAQRERQRAEDDLKKLGQAGAPVAAEPEPTPAERRAETFYSGGEFIAKQTKDFRETVAAQAAATEEHAWINIGKMTDALGFKIDAALIVDTFGIPVRRTEKAAKFWTESDWREIKRKLIARINAAEPLPF